MAWLDDIIGKAGEDADLGFGTKSLLSSNKKERQKGRQLVGLKVVRDFLNNRYSKQADDDWLNFENNFVSQKAKALRDWNMRAEIDKTHQEYLARQRKKGYETLLPVFEDIAGEGWVAKHGQNALDLSQDNRKAYNMYKKIEGERLWKNHKLEYGNFERGPTTLEEFTQPMKTAYETAKKRIYSPYNTTVGGRILRKIGAKEEHNDPTAIEFNTKVAEMMANKELPNIKDDPKYAGLPREFGDIDYLNLTDMKVAIKQLDPRYANINSSVLDKWLNEYQDDNPDSNSDEALSWLQDKDIDDLITSENITNGLTFTKANLAKEYMSLKTAYDRRNFVVRNSGNIPILTEGLKEQGYAIEAQTIISEYDPRHAPAPSELANAGRVFKHLFSDEIKDITVEQMDYMILQIASAAKYVTDPNDQSIKYNIASRAILNQYFGATEDFIDPALTRWDIFNAKAELGTLDIEKENKLTIEEDLERTKEFYDDANDLGKKTEYLEQMRIKIITGVKEARDMTVDQQVESIEKINEIFKVSKDSNKGFEGEEITDDNAWKLFGDEGILFDPGRPMDYFLWFTGGGIGIKVITTGWRSGKAALKSPKVTKALEKTYQRAGTYVRTLTGKGKQVGGFKDPITGKFVSKTAYDIDIGKAFLIGRNKSGTLQRVIYGGGAVAYSIGKGVQVLTDEEEEEDDALAERRLKVLEGQ